MVTVTLIGEKLAREGTGFVYVGPLTECRDCKLKTVCFNLDEGRSYTITSVRGVKHECKIHDEGVRVVEVDKLPIRTTVNARAALEGHTIPWEDKGCQFIGCPRFSVCMPKGMKLGDRYRVTKVVAAVDCPDGLQLKEVLLDL